MFYSLNFGKSWKLIDNIGNFLESLGKYEIYFQKQEF